MEIFLATGNLHKKHEMEMLCPPHTITIPKDIGIKFDPDETGSTFFENSLIKAESLWKIVKKPVIADDSGICVDALDGKPGIYSARYCGRKFLNSSKNENADGHNLSQLEQNSLLIKDVNLTLQEKGLDVNNPENRKCRYVCTIVLYLEKDRFLCAQETFEGILLKNIEESKGINGFGYDPIVFLPEYNKTIAELSEEEKNKISHRGKAVKEVMAAFEKISNQFL